MNQLLPGKDIGSQANVLILGGEALFGETLSSWQVHSPQTRIINEYGPTETVVGCCTYEVPQGVNISGPVPIGRPIANTRHYILDRYLQPVAIGVAGELYIGGDGVARGYLFRPELTREKFIPDPFSTDPESRLYKSGDLCRYLPDGNIEYMGRMDHQVNIRGYRIELGEIEAVLKEYPQVRDSVVLARMDRPQDKQLAAYIVLKPSKTFVKSDLRSFLAERLPDYMLPSAFVILDAFPLTENGKVDRSALPAPDAFGDFGDGDYVAPRSPGEEIMANIWAELLGRKKVSIHDNFFEIGGHSLLATQVISRVIEAFQVELPLRSLFEAPTIVDLVERIETIRWVAKNQPISDTIETDYEEQGRL